MSRMGRGFKENPLGTGESQGLRDRGLGRVIPYLRRRIRFAGGMPLVGPASYLSVADQFLEHWSRVESSDGPVTFDLAGGIDRRAVAEVRSRLGEAQKAVTNSRNSREEERRNLAELDSMIEDRMGQFYAQCGGKEDDVRTADEVLRSWMAIEQAGENLLLEGGFSRLDFLTDLCARNLVASAFSVFDRALSSAREERDGAGEQLDAYLKLYWETIQNQVPVGHLLREGLPLLDLRLGPKPAPVPISASWQEGSALVAWERSEEAELDRYEIRGMAGDHYDQEDEELLGRAFAEDEPRFSTAFALSEPGAVAVFRVYVILRSGHEQGSQPVLVRRS